MRTLLVLMVLLPAILSATTYQTVSSGNWEDAAIWRNGNIPMKLRQGDQIRIDHLVFVEDGYRLRLPGQVELIINQEAVLTSEGDWTIVARPDASIWLSGMALLKCKKLKLAGGNMDLAGMLSVQTLKVSRDARITAFRGILRVDGQCIQRGAESTIQLGNGKLQVARYVLRSGSLIVNGGWVHTERDLVVRAGCRQVLDRATVRIGGRLRLAKSASLDFDPTSTIREEVNLAEATVEAERR